jgi:amidase
MPTTAGSLSLKGSIPLDDAYQTKKLREEGAIILGKANLHEFAFGFETISSLGGQTYNPYDLTRYPGGSSGGTAAAVTSNFVTVGLGTDTGGSIRIPSSFNDLVGIRPTMG